MDKLIIIAGGFALPARNASAVRALGTARLLADLGHKVLILGKLEHQPTSESYEHVMHFDGIEMRDIRKPYPDSVECDYTASAQSLLETAKESGSDRQTAIVLYNYPSRATFQLWRARKTHDLKIILDNTEWRVWEGKKIARNLLWLLDSRIRSYVLPKLCKNALYASHYSEENFPARNMLVFPFVVNPASVMWRIPPADQETAHSPSSGPRRFIYSGSPGLGFFKDCIPSVLKAFDALKAEGYDFHLDVVGLTKDACAEQAPSLQKVLDNLDANVRFHGRVSHDVSVGLLRNSDFSVFIRQPSRTAHIGFSTKFVEATTLGVPLISNPTSDIAQYLKNAENGFLAQSHNVTDVTTALRHAVCLDSADYARMRDRQAAHNPFELARWKSRMSEFLANLQ